MVKALELRGIEKSFKKRRGQVVRALDSVSLTVERGEVIGILGPNGSGKSTLVRVLSTLVTPDRGEVEVFGVDAVRHPKKVQRSMNRVSVEASFFKKLSAMENLLYGAKLYGVTSAEARPRIKEILENIGFAHKRAQEPMEHLSRGMQQKVALARALLTSPVLMLLDEPTTGLDPRSKKDVQAFIQRIREEHDSSVLLCTHDMGEAEELCDRVGIMMDGKILALEEPEGLKGRYASEANGRVPTLEETFMVATGYSVEEASAEGE
ncbi:MAG TPA: ABC transporter ATP-binding protein [Rubrobacter sp.]|nr:ABC transporter ATP-binding protein [Rubrobacter sp.]